MGGKGEWAPAAVVAAGPREGGREGGREGCVRLLTNV